MKKRQYRFYFLSEDSFVLTAEEMRQVTQLPIEQGKNIIRFASPTREGGINLENVNYYVSEEVEAGEGVVVKPPTPAELRHQQEEQKENQPVTLDDQLTNPEVGK